MASTHPSLFLYSLTLNRSNAYRQAIIGQFSGSKQQEVLAATERELSLWKLDTDTGKLREIMSQEAFGIIRSVALFRLTGSPKDYILLGSDSGKITILEYRPETNTFLRIHQETYGKSGVRRVVPGEYLAVDPKGRTCMIASTEKNKLVYVLNRDAAANLTISSPLEAHRPQSILFDVKSLDVGFENPVFAALEIDYADVAEDTSPDAYSKIEKTLTYYELDLGLNHVVRRFSDAVDRTSNKLVPVPGGKDGPSGVLVCSQGWICYRHHQRNVHRVPIPRRNTTDTPQLITSYVNHKMRGMFFFLMQNEDGDLFKLTMQLSEDKKTVFSMRIKYFDSVAPAASLLIFRSGYLFVANENGDHQLYQFIKLGDEDDRTEYASEDFSNDLSAQNKDPAIVFETLPLENIVLADEISSLNPILDAKALNYGNSDAPQIYALCGRREMSTLRVLTRGLAVSELVASELPAVPTAVWTTKLRARDPFDAYIVLSFSNGTLVLTIGETVEEVPDSGFLSSVPTIAVQQLGDDALIQVHPQGIRHIRFDKRINEWKAPRKSAVVHAASNSRQVILALSTREIVYFEIDDEGQLNEYQDRKEMQENVTALSISEVSRGRQRTPFLAVSCDDSTVRIISLDPDNTLDSLSVQALSSPASSLAINVMTDGNYDTTYLHIGLTSGVYLRTVLDVTSGQLADTRTRFLGSRPVQLFTVKVEGNAAVLALSSRSWLSYNYRNSLHLAPLNYGALDYGWTFSSEQCPEGIVSISGQTLRATIVPVLIKTKFPIVPTEAHARAVNTSKGIFTDINRIFAVENLGNEIQQHVTKLSYTPRHFISHPHNPLLYIIEADHNTSPQSKQQALTNGLANGSSAPINPSYGYNKSSWASCIRIYDAAQLQTISKLELESNEAAMSLAMVSFSSQSGETFLAVGTGVNISLSPPSCSKAFIRIYRLINDGMEIELVHKTEANDVPRAMIAFQGRLLVGVGNALRIYEMGQKKVLRKCEIKIPHAVVTLQTQGSRIVVGDVRESVLFVVYKYEENRLIAFADDTVSRWTTSATMMDYETVAGGDKFGNFWLVRCTEKASELSDNDPSGSTLIHDKAPLNSAPHKLQLLAHFFLNDIPTSLQKVCLVSGGRDIVLYTGLSGSIGILVPLAGRDDVDFFHHLEMLMRTEDPPLAGRDHLVHRGYYIPVKNVVDGDFCERYLQLSSDTKQRIANELERSVADVCKKIEDIRGRSF